MRHTQIIDLSETQSVRLVYCSELTRLEFLSCCTEDGVLMRPESVASTQVIELEAPAIQQLVDALAASPALRGGLL